MIARGGDMAQGTNRAADTPQDLVIEVDRRGEMLTCREGDRVATVICTFGARPCLVPRTLEGWWLPREKRSLPLSPEAREALIARIVEHCRHRLGMPDLVIEGD
jgi:hypothetical protein